MGQDVVHEWYENKKNVDEMVHWKKGKLKKWEAEVTCFFPFNAKILDIGCGMGREAFILSDMGFSVVGIDISQEVIKQVSHLSSENGYDIPFFMYDGKNIPFPNQSFDVVIIWAQTFGLLYGNQYKEDFLSECSRILKHNGMLSFSGHDYEYLSAHYPDFIEERKFYPYNNSEIYWEAFTQDDLNGYAKNAGYIIRQCTKGEIYKPEDGVILHCLCTKCAN